MAHTDYHFDWNQSNPSGGYEDPLGFLKQFGDINVTGLDKSSMAFLPSMGQTQTDIGMARTGLGFDMSGQQLAGQQNLLAMTGGQGLAGASGSGFGRSQYGLQQGLGTANQAYTQGLQGSMAGYQADVLGAQYGYQDALTSALGNILASGEDEFNISMGDTGGNDGLNNPNSFMPSGWTGGTPSTGTTHTDNDGLNWVFMYNKWQRT